MSGCNKWRVEVGARPGMFEHWTRRPSHLRRPRENAGIIEGVTRLAGKTGYSSRGSNFGRPQVPLDFRMHSGAGRKHGQEKPSAGGWELQVQSSRQLCNDGRADSGQVDVQRREEFFWGHVLLLHPAVPDLLQRVDQCQSLYSGQVEKGFDELGNTAGSIILKFDAQVVAKVGGDATKFPRVIDLTLEAVKHSTDFLFAQAPAQAGTGLSQQPL